MKLLGETLDIHGGGLDLQFPHHENELAQIGVCTGKPFARVWMHNGLLKMGSGQDGRLGRQRRQHRRPAATASAETVRFSAAQHALPQPDRVQRRTGSTEVATVAARASIGFFERFERITGESRSTSLSELPVSKVEFRRPLDKSGAASAQRFREHMDDDFNTGGAVGVLFELLTALNRFADAAKLDSGAADARCQRLSERRPGVARSWPESSACSGNCRPRHRSAATTSSSPASCNW